MQINNKKKMKKNTILIRVDYVVGHILYVFTLEETSNNLVRTFTKKVYVSSLVIYLLVVVIFVLKIGRLAA